MLRELLRLMRKRVVVVANKSKKVPAGSIITHVWLSKCLILTIMTLIKCLQNLLRDSILSVISIAKKIFF